MKEVLIKLDSHLLHDQLRTLADEYTVTIDLLVNLAVKRLVNDIEQLRKLRAGELGKS